MLFEVLAFIGAVLGIWNTAILLRRSLIHKKDLRLLVDVLIALARLTPGRIDDATLEKLKKILEEHT